MGDFLLHFIELGAHTFCKQTAYRRMEKATIRHFMFEIGITVFNIIYSSFVKRY